MSVVNYFGTLLYEVNICTKLFFAASSIVMKLISYSEINKIVAIMNILELFGAGCWLMD